MRINKHNLTIAEHCAAKQLDGFVTNGLQFTKTGTRAINRCYSVAVSALETANGESTGCIFPVTAKGLEEQAGDGDITVDIGKLPLIKGTAPIITLPDNPVRFEMTLSANFLLKLAQSVVNFTGPEDAVVRVQFTGPSDPVRLDARNSKTGQKWEALVMPRIAGSDVERFAEPVPAPPAPEPIPEESEFDKALKIAMGL
jgi:hypothetical protein